MIHTNPFTCIQQHLKNKSNTKKKNSLARVGLPCSPTPGDKRSLAKSPIILFLGVDDDSSGLVGVWTVLTDFVITSFS